MIPPQMLVKRYPMLLKILPPMLAGKLPRLGSQNALKPTPVATPQVDTALITPVD